ncbi:SGNH/GDSL hydrolase family protein [Maribellus maritimus]|uniref:SGNH/GDSL hydrolase family protein n=1 Tax=Maribellus maritimus TaxID=2870838 RepID=UPI001EEC6B71|nr:SGNH/GDSL hydrolase family protein [Maribellus maritimus]MCG6186252.1 SGNH/GDSL hydrolase family protein [Maribellus maritimus]
MKISRKRFIKALSITGFLGGVNFPYTILAADAGNAGIKEKKSKGLTVLFQGDSITDGNRTRNNDWNHVMGHGYAYLVASRLWFDYISEDLMFYNRGVSGDKIKNLDDRWKEDTLDLHPDVLSILIGVNDVSQIIKNENSIENWKKTYINVLEKTKDALPDTQIALCEPFVLPYNWDEEKTELFHEVISKMQKIVKQLAEKYNAVFIELQQPFKDACKKVPASYWVWDGIHPMPAGHELIARLWIKAMKKRLNFIEE